MTEQGTARARGVRPLDVPGWLTGPEGDTLEALAAACPGDAAIVEIGSFKGRSTIRLAAGSDAGRQARVFAVDPHARGTYPTLLENLRASGAEKLVTPLRMTSEEAARDWNRPIGLLFIDGNHDYEYVSQDYRLWFPHVIEGGVVAFHDSTACVRAGLGGYVGVRRVVQQEIFRSRDVHGVQVVDTITLASKGAPADRKDAFRRAAVRLRKGVTDSVLLGNHYLFRHFRPLRRGLRRLLGRARSTGVVGAVEFFETACELAVFAL